ncbi:MAG: hypothetical protein GX678_07865 [Actinomycetales bacterium]|nr:hypothetical protein [Actinomycetales bacterium]
MWIVDGAAELATVVAPQDGVVLDDSELVNLSPDGGLMLEDKNGMSVGLSVQGATTKPEIVDGAAVETGVDTDLDVVSRATSDGAQILAVLGSKDASNEIGFDLDLPEGAKLATQTDGSILISAPTETEVSLPGEDERIEAATLAILGTSAALDDEMDELTDEQIEQLSAIPDAKTKPIIETLPVAEIETPWAVDANGEPVETRFELDGNTLTQVIETNNNTAFPVVADPSAKTIKDIAVCIVQLGLLIAGPAKIVSVGKWLVSAAKNNKNMKKAKEAVDKMGGLKKTITKIRDYEKNKGKNMSKEDKARIDGFIRYGGNMIAELLGIDTCATLIKNVL